MSCTVLANTGEPFLALIGFGGVLFVAGATLILLTRAHRGRTATIVLLLLIGGGATTGLTGSAPAHAGTPNCAPGPSSSPGSPGSSPTSANPAFVPTGADSLTIVQTSTITGLAPGVAPAAITGTVTNRGTTSTLVTAVTVSIAAVTEAVSVTAGVCDASDYVLSSRAMPVGRILSPAESIDFGGAQIAFSEKPINQDACQRAVISLRYVSS